MKTELDVTKTVKKSNILNELRNANASLVEYRLFCVYLAHLSLKSKDNVVTFSLADYARIAGLDRPRYIDLKAQAHNMVGLTAGMPNEDGGFSVYSLFSEFKLFREDEQWLVSLECNPKIAPQIREQKGRYLRYKLYNTIYLKSFNQQRIYELLKQYEPIGVRLISLEDLRAFLGIGEGEYSVWGDFSQKVLKVAQKALRENTDICFEYEPVKKGRPVVAVKFTIFKNHEFVDLMEMDKFLPAADASGYEGKELVVRAADEDEFGEQTSLFDNIVEPEKTPEQEHLDFFRTALTDPSSLTNEQLDECVTLAKESSWCASWRFVCDLDELNERLRDYIKRQDKYTRANYTDSYYGFMRLACRDNYAKVATYVPNMEEQHESSFEANDFYNAALKKSYGEG